MTRTRRISAAQTTLAIAALAVAATGSSLAIAAGSGATTYFACLKSGALTKVGTHRPAHCAGGGHVISWNQRGRRGAAGLPGPRGLAGTPGIDGTDGTDGTDGSTIRHGAGGPSAATGSVGDFYLDVTDDTLFGPKDATGWGSGTSLIGTPGNDATGGLQGTLAASSIVGDTPWQAPAGVHGVLVELWAAGGGGGCGGNGPEGGGGGAGGGGGYYRGVIPVTPGETYTLTLGSAGSGCGAQPATDGGVAQITNSSDTVLAKVSGGKAGANGGDSDDSGGCVAGSGGNFGNSGNYVSGPVGLYWNGRIGTSGVDGTCGPSGVGRGGTPPDGIGGSIGLPGGFGSGGFGGVGNNGSAFNGGSGYWTLTW